MNDEHVCICRAPSLGDVIRDMRLSRVYWRVFVEVRRRGCRRVGDTMSSSGCTCLAPVPPAPRLTGSFTCWVLVNGGEAGAA